MKKFLQASFILFIVIGSFSMSCKKDDDGDNCADLAQKASDASTEWTYDMTNKDKCKAAKTAIENYLNGCDALDAGTKSAYENTLTLLNCE